MIGLGTCRGDKRLTQMRIIIFYDTSDDVLYIFLYATRRCTKNKKSGDEDRKNKIKKNRKGTCNGSALHKFRL